MPRPLGARQLVELGGHDDRRHRERAQPPRGVHIGFQPRMPAVHEVEHAGDPSALSEVRARHGLELIRRRLAAASVAIARQIHQVERRHALRLHPIEIREAGFSRRRAGARDLLPHERVDETRFADVGPAGEREFREPLSWEPGRIDRAGYENR